MPRHTAECSHTRQRPNLPPFAPGPAKKSAESPGFFPDEPATFQTNILENKRAVRQLSTGSLKVQCAAITKRSDRLKNELMDSDFRGRFVRVVQGVHLSG